MDDIIKLCREFNIRSYTINLDRSIDVDSDVSFFNMGLTEIPIKFGKVSGIFTCAHNKLTSLDNCPKWVGKDFYCQSNDLKSIIGPEYIGGDLFTDPVKEDSYLYGVANVVEYTNSIHVIKDYNNLIKLLKRKDNIDKVLGSGF